MKINGKIKLLSGVLAVAVLGASSLSGCGKDQSQADAASNNSGSSDVTVIQVGTLQNYKPWSYHDENDKLVGYEVEVIEAVDELLPQYEFEFNEGAQDANYTALETGVYQLVLSNAFYTDKRAEDCRSRC